MIKIAIYFVRRPIYILLHYRESIPCLAGTFTTWSCENPYENPATFLTEKQNAFTLDMLRLEMIVLV
jgi:hypothetical protein